MLRGWTVRVLACAGVATALLAGCTEAHQASTSLPPTSPATTSPTLQPLGPPDFPVPAEARTKDAAGVEAFTRYYLALINRTSEVMDATYLHALSDGCETCRRIAANTESDAASGYHYTGGEIRITSAAPASATGNTGQFAFVVDQAALTVVDQAGREIKDLSSEPLKGLSSGATVRWDPGRHTWLMTQLTVG